MANDFSPVRPGDIISSAFINSLASQLQDVEERVRQLEAAGVPPGTDVVAITGFSPATSVAVGQKLVIRGRGFRYPPTGSQVPTNDVTIEGTGIEAQITEFLFDCSDEQLAFEVPPLSINAETPVTIRVRNDRGEAQSAYSLLPAEVEVPMPTIRQVLPTSTRNRPDQIIIDRSADILSSGAFKQGVEYRVEFVVTTGSTSGGDDPFDIFRNTANRPRGRSYPLPGEPPIMAAFVDPSRLRVLVPNIIEVRELKSIPVTLTLSVAESRKFASRVVLAFDR